VKPTVRILRGEEAIRPELGRLRDLAVASGSTFLFNRPEVPLLWFKHFGGKDGADFGARRGRNFYGARTRVEEILYAVAEGPDGRACGMAALAASEVTLKTNAPPLRLLSFCADSVILFYQDLVALPDGREATVEALADALAGLGEREGRLLFLGHIPEDSPNLPALQAWAARRVGAGRAGGLAENRFRGGVYPWSAHKLAMALRGAVKPAAETPGPKAPPASEAGAAKAGKSDAVAPGEGAQKAAAAASVDPEIAARLEALAAKLEAQGPALLGFAATRIGLEKELAAAVEVLRALPDAAESLAAIAACLAGDRIQYPYLDLPSEPEAYLESLSSSRRYYFRRYLKKYSEAGAAFEKRTPDRVTDEDIETYLTLHLERWGGDSVAVNEATLPFHRELCRFAADAGILTLFFATYQGRRLVAHVCLDIGKRREYFFSGRTQGSEELRAGKLMVMHTILDAITSGFSIYDFGYGGDEYKADFTKAQRTARSVFLAPGAEMPELDRLFPKYECFRLL
jgi:hypothetical protein